MLLISDTQKTEYTEQLLEAASDRDLAVCWVDPRQTAFLLSERRIRIYHRGVPISMPLVALFRKTKAAPVASATLAYALHHSGVDLVDPISRFSAGASKVATSFSRNAAGVAPLTIIAFSPQGAEAALRRANASSYITKPVDGSRGQGFLKLTPTEATRYAQQFGYTKPLLIQECIDFVRKHRVLMIGGEVIGHVVRSGNSIGEGRWGRCHDTRVSTFALSHARHDGLLGTDIVECSDGSLYILESNATPVWDGVARASGIDVPRRIISSIIKNLT